MRNVVTGSSAASARVKAGVDLLLVTGNLRGKPTIVIQGRIDTTLPVNFTARPYVALNSLTEGANSCLSYIEFTNRDHTVDALSSIRSLEAMVAYLSSGATLPPNQVVRPVVATKTYPKFVAAPAVADRISVSAGVLTIPN
jgi:hydroxybutyrate-dimer hydrolase